MIDRRSFLIAAVGYVVTLASTVFGADEFPSIMLALGAALLAIGAGWERLRAVLVGALAPVLPLRRLPPAA